MENKVDTDIKNGYYCKECKSTAYVKKDGTILRTCNHTTTIILDLHVVATGESEFAVNKTIV